MITKLCIVCLCMTASAMFGLTHFKSRKERVTYFDLCVKLCDKLISDINFRKDSLLTVLGEFAENTYGEFETLIKSYCADPYAKIRVGGKLLKREEKQLIGDFFMSLGCTDTQTQIGELQNFRTRFESIYKYENEKFKKSGSLGLKLSVLFGIAVGILIL